jgi:hypothetical protein
MGRFFSRCARLRKDRLGSRRGGSLNRSVVSYGCSRRGGAALPGRLVAGTSVRAIVVAFLVLTVAACSAPTKIVDRLGPEPDVRKVISERKLFTDAEARVLAFSKPRPWRYSTFYGWRVCLKAAVAGANGGLAPKTYAVFLQRDDILDRREAVPDDLCGTEQLDPFTPEAPPAVAQVAAPAPPRAETGVLGGMFDWLKF